MADALDELANGTAKIVTMADENGQKCKCPDCGCRFDRASSW